MNAAPDYQETFSMEPDDRARLAEDIATVVRTQLELAKPVKVEHEFNGLGKNLAWLNRTLIGVLVAVVGWLAIQVYQGVATRDDARAVAREVVAEVRLAQAAKDSQQDADRERVVRILDDVVRQLAALQAKTEFIDKYGSRIWREHSGDPPER